MLRPKHRLEEGKQIKAQALITKSDDKGFSISGRGYKTSVQQLSKIFQTLEINRPKHQLPPLMMQVKHTKAESFFNDGAFMKTFGKNLGKPKTECFMCYEKGQTQCDHNDPLITGFKTGAHWNKTGYSASGFKTGNIPRFSNNLNIPIMSKTLDTVSRSRSTENKHTKDSPMLFTILDKTSRISELSMDWVISEDIQARSINISHPEKAIMISNEGHKNILDNEEFSKESPRLKASTYQGRSTHRKTHHEQRSASKNIDLKDLWHNLFGVMKDKANNDNERPFLDSVMRPRNRESKYYISQLKPRKDEYKELKYATHLDLTLSI